MRTALAVVVALFVTDARAQPSIDDAGGASAPLVVGVFAPQLYFPDSPSRQAYAHSIASGLEARIGRPVISRGFATRGEFLKQAKAGKVDFALVDAQFHLEHSNMRPVAQGTAGGKATRPMVVAIGIGAKNVGELRGRKLATVDVGEHDDRVIANLLLQRQTGPGYFGAGPSARDVAGALSPVEHGKADAAFTYAGATGGQASVYKSPPVPLPVFVVVRAGVSDEAVAAVRSGLVGIGASGGLVDGFAAYAPGVHGALRRAMGRAVTAPASGEPLVVRASDELPFVEGFFETRGRPDVRLPSALGAFEIPAKPEDAF